ncbi:DUF6958 family protein [Pontibacter vulgaris]|uniref:DUF6958 family protein n=1 Tax=Pontibacter vulgaris TaxID=2905679 RepID=UPI001FA6B890|nr:hypothetical protein [Pontibacter vulgaris]
MELKMQLLHPAGKKAVSMNEDKYTLLKESLLKHLMLKGESTHTEILQAVTEDFKNNETAFKGSLAWHLEWVKLDLEARNEIKRTGVKAPIKFGITKQGDKQIL